MDRQAEAPGNIRRWLNRSVWLAVAVIWFFATWAAAGIWLIGLSNIGLGNSEAFFSLTPGDVIVGVLATLVAGGASVYLWTRCGRRWP